jgi:hypothetical protein
MIAHHCTTRIIHWLTIACALTLAACGGGGGGGGGDNGGTTPPPATQTLSGTAAAGAPIIGTVFVKDSTGAVRSVPIDANGSYTISVAGMTPPFLVRAEGVAGGRVYTIHSAATAADINGNINITPLTDLIVANIARQVAANYYSSGNFSTLTAAELNVAENTLQQRLQAVLTALGVGASIDLLRSAFSANHTGLDAALDVIRVTVDAATNTALITNVINNANITDDLTLSTDSSLLDSTGTASGLSDWERIRARLASFEAAFATGLPSPTDPLLLAQFNQAGFLDEGNNLATFLGGLTSDPSMVGFRFASLSLASLTPATAAQNGRAVVIYGVGDATYGYGYGDTVMTGIYNAATGTNWVIAGDQRIADYGAEMRSILGFNSSGPSQLLSGIAFDTDADPAGIIDYAVITGPGLPTSGAGRDGNSAGVLLARNSDGMFVATPPYIGPATATHSRAAAGHTNMYWWTDTEIAALPADNLTYTQRYYDDNGTPSNLADDVLLATYEFTLLKPPLPAGSLSAVSFPVITSPTAAAAWSVLSAGAGGPLTATWNLPAGLAAESFVAARFYGIGNDNAIEVNVSPTTTSVTVDFQPPTGTVTGGELKTVARDFYNRNYSYRLRVQP